MGNTSKFLWDMRNGYLVCGSKENKEFVSNNFLEIPEELMSVPLVFLTEKDGKVVSMTQQEKQDEMMENFTNWTNKKRELLLLKNKSK